MSSVIKRISVSIIAALLLVGCTGCSRTGDLSSVIPDTQSSGSLQDSSSEPEKSFGSGVDKEEVTTNSATTGTKQKTLNTGTSTNSKNNNIDAVTGSLNIKNRSIQACDSSYDQVLLDNPDRGLRLETLLSVDGKYPRIQSDPVIDLREQWDFYMEESPRLAQAYFYLTGYRDTPTLPQEAFTRMQKFFDTARQYKLKLLLRFAYQYDQENLGPVKEGEKGEAKQSIMLAHLNQLKPFLEKNKDVIHVVQVGMIGAWGEWHSYSDSGEYQIDEAAILKKVLEVTPKSLFVQIRDPIYKNTYGIGLPQSELSRIGYHNDAVFGYPHTWAKTLSPGTEGYNQITREGPFMPQDGELFWGYQIKNSGKLVDGGWADKDKTELKWENVIGMLAEHRYTSFSLRHSYREPDGGLGLGPFSYSMDKWKKREVTPEILDRYGLFYAPGWFKKGGKTISRNAFEYLQDYLGYKLELLSFSASGNLKSNNSIDASIQLTNYGFSAAFNIESGFAILDTSGKVVSTVKAGNPATWHSRTPGATAKRDANGFQGFEDKTRMTHTVSAKIKLPAQKGIYYIAFYARSTNGEFVKFGNNMTVKNGFHILETVQVG